MWSPPGRGRKRKEGKAREIGNAVEQPEDQRERPPLCMARLCMTHPPPLCPSMHDSSATAMHGPSMHDSSASGARTVYVFLGVLAAFDGLAAAAAAIAGLVPLAASLAAGPGRVV